MPVARDLHSAFYVEDRAVSRKGLAPDFVLACHRPTGGWRRVASDAQLFCVICALWGFVKIAERYLKFRAALSEWWCKQQVVPDRNGIVQQYTDLELKIRTGGHYGGHRAVFITTLAEMEDELLELREYVASMRREEARAAAIRRADAIAHSRRKLDEQDQ